MDIVDFEEVFDEITTQLFREDGDYAQAYKDFWTAREHLCSRFGLDWEDEDLELFMNGILMAQEDFGRRVFEVAKEYAKKELEFERRFGLR